MSAGHVRQRGENRWELRWRAAGKVRTVTVAAKSRRDAEKQLATRIADAQIGKGAIAPAKLTVGTYIDEWLAGLDLAPMTMVGYTSVAKLYLKPDLGHVRLRDLGAPAIRLAFMKWHARGLARSTLRRVKVCLQSCLRSALLDDLIAVSPMDRLRKRKGERDPLPVAMSPRATPVPADKITELLAEQSEYRIAIVLMVAAGLRRGETVGLRWRNVDLEAGKIRVVEQRLPLNGGAIFAEPKATASVRTITLPPEAVADLRVHRTAEAERLLSLGIRLTPEATVVCDALGQPVSPKAISEWARRRGFKLHNIRHAHLSALANSGIPIAAVSKRAGHSTIATTIATYVHADDADDEAAAAVAGRFMRKQ
jgi:integrase